VVHSDALRGERFALRARVDVGGFVYALGAAQRVLLTDLPVFAEGVTRVSVSTSPGLETEHGSGVPSAAAVTRIGDWRCCGPVSLTDWEPEYGRLAEAQVKWEREHGHALPAG